MEEKHYTPKELKKYLSLYYDLWSLIHQEREEAERLRTEGAAAYDVQLHEERAKEYADARCFLSTELQGLDRIDRNILRLKYMGPEDMERRQRGFRAPTWKQVATLTGYSESHTISRAQEAIGRLSALPVIL